MALLDWSVAGEAFQPGQESGDRHLVTSFPGGALVALVDGLGHGPQAAIAAQAAVEILAAHAAEPVERLVELCHAGLKQTRGAAMTLASLDERTSTLTWLGVGNVEGLLFLREGCQAVMLAAGVVGYQLPPLRPKTIALVGDELLVLATDGVDSPFREQVVPAWSPQTLAHKLHGAFRKGTDDSLVVVARYLGGPRGKPAEV